MSLNHYVEPEDFQSTRPSLAILKKVMVDLWTDRGLFILGFCLIISTTAATLIGPRILGYAVDTALVPHQLFRLRQLTLIFLVNMGARALSITAQTFVFEKLAQRMMQRLRIKVFSHYQSLPMGTFDRTPVGRLITRITNDTSAMAEMFSAGFITMFGNILFIIGSFVWLFVLKAKLALAAAFIFPILILASIHFSKRLVIAYRDSRIRISALNAYLAENILGIRIVHLFNRIETHFARFSTVNDEYLASNLAAVRVYAYFQPLITWCAGISVAAVLIVGGRAGIRGELTPGELIAFITYLLALFQPIRELVDRWTIFLSGMASAERIYGVLEWEAEMPEDESLAITNADLPELRGEIRFENVWFAYSDENWVLRDFSLHILPGQRVGIVGHTGAGKSTLIHLLMRFYDFQRGRITIDGIDIREYPKRELRARLGLIAQDIFLFAGPLSRSITFDDRAPSPSVRDVLNRFGFPHALDEELDERASNLSVGERQILAFARALESRPSVWILDEATANVDSESEERLSQSLALATEGKTLLMIAHRLATVKTADQILVLHQGTLAEKGTHSELLKLGGYYARLYRYQAALENTGLSSDH